MIKKIFLLFLISINFLNAQTFNTDSLLKVFQNPPSDTAKVKAAYYMASKLWKTEPEKALNWINTGILIAKNKTLIAWQARGYFNKSQIERRIGKLDDAIENLKISIQLSHDAKLILEEIGRTQALGITYKEKTDYKNSLTEQIKAYNLSSNIKDYKLMAMSYCNVGNVYIEQSSYDSALYFYSQSAKLYDQINYKKGKAEILGNIGTVYFDLKQFEKAEKVIKESAQLFLELNDKEGYANCLTWLGNLHATRNIFDSAIFYFNNAKKIHEEFANYNELSFIYTSIGEVYADKKDFTNAMEYYIKSLTIRRKLGMKDGEAYTLERIANLLIRQNKFKEALPYLTESLQLGKSVGSLEDVKYTYYSFYKAYSGLKDYQMALQSHEQFLIYHDSILNESTAKQIEQLSSQFQSDKQENEIKLLNKDKLLSEEKRKREKNFLYLISAAAGLFVVLAVVLLFGFLNKRKSNILLHKQKEIIEEKQKEILDSIYYARRIQRSLLTQETYIEKHLRKLKGN